MPNLSNLLSTKSTITTVNNLSGGAVGSVPYQSAANTTAMLSPGTNGQVLTLASGVPSWATVSTTSIGVNQTWQNMTSARAANTIYYNTTGSPIFVAIIGQFTIQSTHYLYIDGALITDLSTVGGGSSTLTAIIKAGSNYRWQHDNGTLTSWWELR